MPRISYYGYHLLSNHCFTSALLPPLDPPPTQIHPPTFLRPNKITWFVRLPPNILCLTFLTPHKSPLPLFLSPYEVSFCKSFWGFNLLFVRWVFSFSMFTPSSTPPVRPGSPRPEPPLCRRSPPCRSKSPGKYFNLLSSVSHKAQK